MGDHLRFDENGDPPATYELLNWQVGSAGNVQFQVIGDFDSTINSQHQLRIHEKSITWNNNNNKARVTICSAPLLSSNHKTTFKVV